MANGGGSKSKVNSRGGNKQQQQHKKHKHNTKVAPVQAKKNGDDDNDDDFDLALLESTSSSSSRGSSGDPLSLLIGVAENFFGLFGLTNNNTTAGGQKKKTKKNSFSNNLSWKSYAGSCALIVLLSIVLDRFDFDIMDLRRSLSKKMFHGKTKKSSSSSSSKSHGSRQGSSGNTIDIDIGNYEDDDEDEQHSSIASSPLQKLIQLVMCNSDSDNDSSSSSPCIYDKILQVVDRTIFAGPRGIESDRKLLEISRVDQIWTVDALRSFNNHQIFQNVLKATHIKTEQKLTSQSHLALYLAILKKQQQQQQQQQKSSSIQENNNTSTDGGATLTNQKSDDLVLEDDFLTAKQKIYLDLLPTYQDFDGVHPVTFPLRTLNSLFGSNTNFYYLVTKRKVEIESEYKAFQKSIRNSNNSKESKGGQYQLPISYQEYVAARLVVQTRGFKAGPMEYGTMSEQLSEDLELYREAYDVPSGQTIFVTAMVPILDALNHHHKNRNVQWKYVPGTEKFIAYSAQRIPAGAELHDTYGDRADLYATYGFVNGDLSERSSALMAAHSIVDSRVVPESKYLQEQKSEILRYLQHDDGYLECINENTNEDGMEMKRLKRQAILLLANAHTPWLVSFPARDSDPTSSSVPIDDGMAQIVNTARLMALTHRDYDGAAPTILEDIVAELEEASSPNDYRFNLDKGDDGLEYRTMVWLWRFAAFNLEKYHEVTSQDEQHKMTQLEVNSKEWYASYVRYQELIALETIKAYADQAMPTYITTFHNNPSLEEDFFFRSDLCPIDTQGLYELMNE